MPTSEKLVSLYCSQKESEMYHKLFTPYDITLVDERIVGGEPVADLRVRHAPLTAIDVPPELTPSMIDEYPALFVAAALLFPERF